MSDTQGKRSHRVGELIQHELAALITHEVKDPRVGFVTVTEVRAASDLKTAKVFVSIYGSDEERAASLAGLMKAAGFLKREISRRLSLRYTPELSFELDATLDKAARLQELMQAIERGDTETPQSHTQPTVPVHTNRTGLKELEAHFSERGKQKKDGRRHKRRR